MQSGPVILAKEQPQTPSRAQSRVSTEKRLVCSEQPAAAPEIGKLSPDIRPQVAVHADEADIVSLPKRIAV